MEERVHSTASIEGAHGIWRRRKWLALSVFLAVLSAGVAVVWSLPNVYESTATLLVEHQRIPESLAGPSLDTELETRLRAAGEQILSRSRLHDLIARLYPQLRPQALGAVVEQLRRDIRLQFNGVHNAGSGADATISLGLSYRGRDPQTVAQVTNAVAVLYVEENARIRGQEISGTAEFLRRQIEQAQIQLDTLEQRMSAFKARYIGELPEQQAMNLAALERLNEQLRVAMIRRDALASQMAQVHGVAGDVTVLRLIKLRQILADLRTQYTDEHPRVVLVKQEITDLERQLAATGGRPTAVETSVGAPQGYPSIVVPVEFATLGSEEQLLQRAVATYEQRVKNAPIREQQLEQIARDYTAASAFYSSLVQRYEGAQLAERMDQRLQGGQFRILDPAVPSRQPVAPNRLRLALLSLMLSGALAVGVALLAEVRDTSFHTVDDLRAFTSVPVLASIPLIITESDARRRRQRVRLAGVAVPLGVAAIFVATSFLVRTSGALVFFSPLGRF